jgi:hypothetical protein
LLLTIGGLSKIEITDTSESKIWAGVFIIWAFSYVGWLTVSIATLSPDAPFYILNQYANQYMMAIIASVLAAGLTFKEMFT